MSSHYLLHVCANGRAILLLLDPSMMMMTVHDMW